MIKHAYSLLRLSFITGRASQNVSTFLMFFGLWRQQQLVANWKAKVVTADEHAKFVNDPWSGPCNLLHLLNSAQRKFNGLHIQLTNARLPKMKLLQLWGICCQVARGCRLHIFPDFPSIPVYSLPLVFFLQRRGHAPCSTASARWCSESPPPHQPRFPPSHLPPSRAWSDP